VEIVPDYEELTVGESVTLKCVTSGDPSPTVRWLRVPSDDAVSGSMSLIEESDADDNRISVDGGLLVIRNATLDDEGTYICEAANKVGEPHRLNATLDVLG
jgi:hypothetical protein